MEQISLSAGWVRTEGEFGHKILQLTLDYPKGNVAKGVSDGQRSYWKTWGFGNIAGDCTYLPTDVMGFSRNHLPITLRPPGYL